MNGAQFRAISERHIARRVAAGEPTGGIVWTPEGGWTDTPEGQREAERVARRIRLAHDRSPRA